MASSKGKKSAPKPAHSAKANKDTTRKRTTLGKRRRNNTDSSASESEKDAPQAKRPSKKGKRVVDEEMEEIEIVAELEVIEEGNDNNGNLDEDEGEPGDELEDHHRAAIPGQVTVKSELARDVCLMFSANKVPVQFTIDGKPKVLMGRWCFTCSHVEESTNGSGGSEAVEEVQQQMTLDAMFPKALRPNEFSREAIVHAVSQFVACDDQASSSDSSDLSDADVA
ncbi:hypothetical protein JOM56_004446 [Amanita muscaria]